MFGQFEEQQKALQEELKQITVEAQAGDGAIKVSANATRELTNIAIDTSKLDMSDAEELEDLLMVAVNRVMELAAAKEAEKTQAMVQSILPPGMGGLANMFG